MLQCNSVSWYSTEAGPAPGSPRPSMWHAAFVLLAGAAWAGHQVSAVDAKTESLQVQGASTHHEVYTTYAVTHRADTHVYFREDAAQSTRSAPRTLSVQVVTSLAFSPRGIGRTLALQLPPAVSASLLRICMTGMSPACDAHGSMCLCTGAGYNASSAPAPPPGAVSGAPLDCSQVLQHSPRPGDIVYAAAQWHELRLPCIVQPQREYVLQVLSAPVQAFRLSAPYTIPHHPGDSRHPRQAVAMTSANEYFVVSTLDSGADRSFSRLVVTAPANLVVLASTEVERSQVLDGALPPFS
jgi:hypothetical protein